MTKYMIQDIVPPDRKRVHAGKRSSVPSHEREAQAPISEADRATAVHHRSRTVTPSTRKSTEEKTVEVPEIEDMLPENPRAMILEHLYEDNSRAETPLTYVESRHDHDTVPALPKTSGTWPSNEKTPTLPADPDRHVPPQFPSYRSDRPVSSSWIPWLLVPALLLIGAFFLFDHFARASVIVIPKQDVIPMEGGQEFVALKEPGTDDLGFSVMKVSLEDMIEVAATGTKTVTSKASGAIIVYNEQTTSQRLIKNTRFQSAAGKIYRINDSVVIPKATIPKGGKLTPGSLQVMVYADEAGPEYNSEPTDFTVPGLKDLPQYKKVYARSKGAITGGASGTIKSVSDQDLRQASDDLRVSLETKLRTKAHGDMAPSQIGYDQGIVVDLVEPKLSTTKASRDDRAVVTASGTLYYVVFDRTSLTKALAHVFIPTYDGEPVVIERLDSLKFMMPEIDGSKLWTSDKLEFTLGGNPSIKWDIDEQKVKSSLIGIPKSNFNAVMSQFSTIERAKGVMRPFWKSTYPEDPEAISLEIVSEISE